MNILIFYYLYNLSKNNFIGNLAIALHNFTYPTLALILILTLFVAKRKFFSSSLLVLSGLFAWFISEILKFSLHISRPFIDLGITPLVYQSGFAFPSQHMAVFSALAISMFIVDKKFAITLLILSIIIGISRVILGVHYPIDIIGGLFIGILVSFVLINIFKKI